MDTIKNAVKKSGRFLTKRNLLIVCAVLLIGGAVVLNWTLFGGELSEADAAGDLYDGEPSDGAESGGAAAPYYVDAKPSENDAYFSTVQINRQRARDEAMEVLMTIVDSAEAADVKSGALEGISTIAANIENEANIETLIMAKGFAECVAVIGDSGVNIVVGNGGALMPNEIAQIKEIVCEQCGVGPQEIKIIEKSE